MNRGGTRKELISGRPASRRQQTSVPKAISQGLKILKVYIRKTWHTGGWVAQLGSRGQARHSLGLNHAGSGWLQGSPCCLRGSFGPLHNALQKGLLPELKGWNEEFNQVESRVRSKWRYKAITGSSFKSMLDIFITSRMQGSLPLWPNARQLPLPILTGEAAPYQKCLKLTRLMRSPLLGELQVDTSGSCRTKGT